MTRTTDSNPAGVRPFDHTEPRYVGGPLHGQPAARHNGHWSTWRDNTGRHVPTAEGDQRFLGHSNGAGPPFYVCLAGDGIYRHSTVLRTRSTT